MCYSAQIWSDYRKYERLGGVLDIKGYVRLAGWARKNGSWIKVVPRGLRAALVESRLLSPELADAAAAAEAEGMAAVAEEIQVQIRRLAEAEAKLSSKPTKKAANDARIATNRIAASRKKLDELERPSRNDGLDRIWPGHFAPVLICDPETGERLIAPMRYRCRLPGWTAADEAEKPGTYNARRDKLTTVWRRVFGVTHGVVAVDRFYESVHLHDLQRRALLHGEREQKVEIAFIPQEPVDLYVACLYTYTEAEGDDPPFYSFAAITDNPPPEVAAAGHDRCIVTLREADIDAWLSPAGRSTAELQAILDRGIAARPYFEHAFSE